MVDVPIKDFLAEFFFGVFYRMYMQRFRRTFLVGLHFCPLRGSLTSEYVVCPIAFLTDNFTKTGYVRLALVFGGWPLTLSSELSAQIFNSR